MVENALLWGVIGVAVATSGWALYNDVFETAEQTSDHSQRRASIENLSKTRERAIIKNPATPNFQTTTNQERIHASPGSDEFISNEPEEENSPWKQNVSVSLQPSHDYVDGETHQRHTFYHNAEAPHTKDYADALSDCMTQKNPLNGIYNLNDYVGFDFWQSQNSNCFFTRTIFVTNQYGEFIPLFTTSMAEDSDSESFTASFFPDQLVQWSMAGDVDCSGLSLRACEDRRNDPKQNKACYSEAQVFKPSLCNAAPVLNQAGETIMWRSAFESQPLDWRQPINLEHSGIGTTSLTGYNYYLSALNRERFVPDIPSTTTIDLTLHPGHDGALPEVNPGCPPGQNSGSNDNYNWGASCSPTFTTPRLSSGLDDTP